MRTPLRTSGDEFQVKYPAASESAKRIRETLDRRNAMLQASAAAPTLAPAMPVQLAGPANNLATTLRRSFPAQDGLSQSDLAPAYVPFPERKPEIGPGPIEPVFLGTTSRSLDSARRLPIRVWVVSGLVAVLTILGLALPFPLQLTGANYGKTAFAQSADPKASPSPVMLNPVAAAVGFTPIPRSTSAAPNSERHVSIRVNQPAWMSACADNEELFRTLFSPGAAPNIKFANRAIVRIGNAGGVDMAMDGSAIGTLGAKGELRIVEFTQEGFRPLTLAPGDARPDCELAN